MGARGGGLGAIWAPKAVWHRNKEPEDQKMTTSGLLFSGPFLAFSVIFDVFLRSFSSLHFDGYQDQFFMDFDQFFGSFLKVVFITFQIVGKQGKCHSDSVFTLF